MPTILHTEAGCVRGESPQTGAGESPSLVMAVLPVSSRALMGAQRALVNIDRAPGTSPERVTLAGSGHVIARLCRHDGVAVDAVARRGTVVTESVVRASCNVDKLNSHVCVVLIESTYLCMF